ncbi:MAG: transposase [Tepidisphaeraceae bacterium]
MGKHYTRQFREQAVKLVMTDGRRPSQVARELGMPHSTMMLWLHKAGYQEPDPDGVLGDDPAVLQAQVKELRRQNKRLEMEKDI